MSQASLVRQALRDEPQAGDFFMHWKRGDIYRIHCVSKGGDTESNERLVVYTSQLTAKNPVILYHRELNDFLGSVSAKRFKSEGAAWSSNFAPYAKSAFVPRFVQVDKPGEMQSYRHPSARGWACVSRTAQPLDSADLMVVRVAESPQTPLVGFVTRYSDGVQFKFVYGGVHSCRDGARAAKEQARQKLGLTKVTARAHYGGV